MQVVETFGQYVQRWSGSHPDRARDLLRLGWGAQNLKNKYLPDRRLLPADQYLAKIMNNFPSYDVKMTEVHHIHKLDAPSGTAITLAEGILENIDRKDRWTLENAENATDLPIHAIREGEVPGIHEITYESDVDTISIKHDAKSRAGFALGAVIAAEFTAGKKGFLGMNDLFKF